MREEPAVEAGPSTAPPTPGPAALSGKEATMAADDVEEFLPSEEDLPVVSPREQRQGASPQLFFFHKKGECMPPLHHQVPPPSHWGG